MNDRGHSDLCLTVDDDHLSERLLEILRGLDKDSDRIRDEIGRAIPRQLRLMGEMGMAFLDEVHRVYPDFPRNPALKSWEHHLPPLPDVISNILEKYA